MSLYLNSILVSVTGSWNTDCLKDLLVMSVCANSLCVSVCPLKLLNCLSSHPYVWFHRLTVWLLCYKLCTSECAQVQFHSPWQEFLQSATLTLICINQGPTCSFVFILFFHNSFLLQGMHVEIHSRKKCINKINKLKKLTLKSYFSTVT